MGLTDDAKREIEAAIKIVREDKVHEYIRRSSQPKPADPPAPTPPAGPPTPPGGPTPPPPTPPAGPPADPPTGKKSAYWGELLDD